MKTLEEMYGEVVAGDELKARFAEAAKEEKVLEFLAADGCEATAEEVKAFLEARKEVSADELDDVAGGCDGGQIINSAVVTALTTPLASHIKPWADASDDERLSPGNGLLLNACHDRAFDRGLITIDQSLGVVASEKARRRYGRSEADLRWLLEYEGERISLPKAKPPEPEFVRWHNERVFLDGRAS